MGKPRSSPAPSERSERRSGQDRRRLEKGPPGTHDRRRLVEPRRPEVEEIELTLAEWEALHQAAPAVPVDGKHGDGSGER